MMKAVTKFDRFVIVVDYGIVHFNAPLLMLGSLLEGFSDYVKSHVD